MMKFALVLLFCSVSTATALPPGRWLEEFENMMSDQHFDSHDEPFPQFEQKKGVKVDESIKFVQEPRGIIDQPNTQHEYEQVQEISKPSGSFSALK